MRDNRWTCDYLTDNPVTFLELAKRSQRCFLFVDESGVNVGQHDREMYWLATQSRHYGHSTTFIAQRAQQIAKTVRDQCSYLALFCCSFDDSKTLANEYNKQELREAHSLQKGEFFSLQRFGPLKRLNVNGLYNVNSS